MYFIYDCENNIVGNPKGYATFSAAERQQNRVGSPAFNAIWTLFNMKKLFSGDTKTNVLVCSIKLVE